MASTGMRVSHLEHFVAAVEHGSFAAAALRCGVSQPAISQSMSSLERAVSAQLFRRVHGRVAMTPAGRALLPVARQVLDDLTAAREAVRRTQQLAGGLLQIAAPAAMGVDPLARLLGAFHDAHPEVAVRVLRPHEDEDSQQLLLDGRADVALALTRSSFPALKEVFLGHRELLAVLPSGGSRGARAEEQMQPLPLDELLAQGLVVTPGGSPTRRLLDQLAGAEAVTSAVVIETDFGEEVLNLILAGAGAGLLPARQARAAATHFGVSVRRVWPALRQEMYLAHADAAPDQIVRAFNEVVGAAAIADPT